MPVAFHLSTQAVQNICAHGVQSVATASRHSGQVRVVGCRWVVGVLIAEVFCVGCSWVVGVLIAFRSGGWMGFAFAESVLAL